MIELKCDRCKRKIKCGEIIGICPDCDKVTCSECENKIKKHK
jgi:threonine synthase